MSNKNFATLVLIFFGVYSFFFKADVFYFIHQWTLEKNVTLQKLQKQNLLLREKVMQIPLVEGHVITQMNQDFMVINRTNRPLHTAVFGRQSVIGKIASQTRLTQTVRLITNRSSKVAVFVPEVGRAILKGEGGKKLTLTYIDFLSSHRAFKKGDIIYTLGIEGQFPKKKPIAIVSEVCDERNIMCQPFENVDELTEVSLLNLS